MSWLEQLAAALEVEPLGPEEETELLDAARQVAHGVERKITPLATFLLGMGMQSRIAAGASRDEAFAATVADLRAALPS